MGIFSKDNGATRAAPPVSEPEVAEQVRGYDPDSAPEPTLAQQALSHERIKRDALASIAKQAAEQAAEAVGETTSIEERIDRVSLEHDKAQVRLINAQIDKVRAEIEAIEVETELNEQRSYAFSKMTMSSDENGEDEVEVEGLTGERGSPNNDVEVKRPQTLDFDTMHEQHKAEMAAGKDNVEEKPERGVMASLLLTVCLLVIVGSAVWYGLGRFNDETFTVNTMIEQVKSVLPETTGESQ